MTPTPTPAEIARRQRLAQPACNHRCGSRCENCPEDETPADIAQRLSKAQRDGLTRRPCPSWYEGPPASFPASVRTAQALWNRGLIYGHGSTRHKDAYALTPLGLAVRAELERMEAGDG